LTQDLSRFHGPSRKGSIVCNLIFSGGAVTKNNSRCLCCCCPRDGGGGRATSGGGRKPVVKGGGSLPSDQTIHSQDNIHGLPVFWEFWARFSVQLCVRCRSCSLVLASQRLVGFWCCLPQGTTKEYQVLNLSLLDVGRLLALKHSLHLEAPLPPFLPYLPGFPSS
jgi:hypothetical protein